MTMQRTVKLATSLLAATALSTTASVYAAGVGTHAKPDWPIPVHDDTHFSKLMIDRLEYAAGDEEDTLNWEAQFWYGGDRNRFYIEGEGEDVVSGGEGGHVEQLDFLYSRLVASYWDFQSGIGYEREYGPGPDKERSSLVVGIQGLAPYWFEVDSNLRISDDGDVSADLEAEYDWMFTQRTVLQGRFETVYAASEVDKFEVGQGFNNLKLGLRLRYEFMREFAPYIGVSWNKLLGDTKDLAAAEGKDTEVTSLVAGVRMWF